MNNKNRFLLQLFEKIGLPLFASVNDVSARAIMTGQATNLPTDAEQAEIIAKLLTKITKVSSSVSEKLDLGTNDPDLDDLQVSLAAIVSPVVSNLYQLTGQIPKEDDIEKIVLYFETLSTFSNNFSSLQEGASRLEKLPANTAAQDKTQNSLQNIMSTTPLINAVAAFPFGEAPEKLLKKVIQRIQKNVDDIIKTMPENISNDATTYTGIFNTVIMIYSQCHFSEMARIMAMGDKEREANPISVDNVWTLFEQRIDMLKALVGSMIESSNTTEQTNISPSIEITKEPEIQEEPEKNSPEKVEIPAPEEAVASQSSENPMSFFSKKKKEESPEE